MSLLPPRGPRLTVEVPEWSDEAIRAWTSQLGVGREAQRDVVTDILIHAGRDHMSKEDRSVCRRALGLLEGRGR